jgi:hypothetical protein
MHNVGLIFWTRDERHGMAAEAAIDEKKDREPYPIAERNPLRSTRER